MQRTVSRNCPRCGANFSGSALKGLCPACVGRFVLVIEPASAEGSVAAETAGPRSRLRYFGDYEIEAEVARGGMGVVYKARQLSLNRPVAVKMILGGQLASVADVQRFRAEAEAAANLRHPHIVAIHEVGEHDGQHFFSMNFVEGRNLAQVSADARSSSIKWFRRAAGWVKILAETIHYAHEQGTLHRDLKPSNVLIDAKDQPHITDFGLAKRFKSDSDLTLTGQILGTPNFMPPEQASGKRDDIGPHSDVYSLGAVLYFLVTGKPPFAADTVHQTLSLVVGSEPVSPCALDSTIPRDLQTICLKCLDKQPVRRYVSAQALADDLDRFLADRPILAHPVGRAGKLLRLCRRHRLVTSLVAGVVLLPVIAAFMAGHYAKSSGSASPTGFDPGPVASMPTNCAYGVAGIIGDRIYVTSASDGNGEDILKALYAYDSKANVWERMADTALPHLNPAGGIIAGKLYVAGGDSKSGALGALESFDPLSNTWTTKAPMPTARASCAGVVLNDRLYVIAGRDETNLFSTVESYDPRTDTWKTEPPMLNARSGCGAAVIEATIYVVGGTTNWGSAPAEGVEMWKPGEKWTIAPGTTRMDRLVTHAFITAFDGRLFVAGGDALKGSTDLLQVYLPHWSGNNGIWQKRSPLPELRYQGCGTVVLGGQIYVFGGWEDHVNGDGLPHPDVFVYDPRHNSWRRSAPARESRSGKPSLGKG